MPAWASPTPATVRVTPPPRCPPGWRWPPASTRRWRAPRARRSAGRRAAAGSTSSWRGAMNLARDPRNGRNFEYLSEDPLLSATIAAESINGIQHQGVISTVKHYSLNCNETNRHWLDAVIDPDAHRESDLLAFEIAIERAQPGAVMAAYNKVNGDYAVGQQRLDQRRTERRLGIPRLGHVRLGWHTELGVRAGRPRPGVRCADRRHALAVGGVHRPTASRLRRRQASQGAAVGHGPADPAVDVRRRNRPVGRARRRRIWPRTTRLRCRSRGRESCCCRTAGCLPLAVRFGRAHRRHRRLRAASAFRSAAGPAPSSPRAATPT